MVTERLSDLFGRGAAALRLCIGRHQSGQDVAPLRPYIRILLGKRCHLDRVPLPKDSPICSCEESGRDRRKVSEPSRAGIAGLLEWPICKP